MPASDVRKNFNVYADGRGYAGQASSYSAPKLSLKTEEFQGGGMLAPVALTMGMEALKSEFSLVKYDKDILALFGVTEGSTKSFTVYEVLESFGSDAKTSVVHNMTGKITEIDPGESKPGSVPELKVSIALTYYKLSHGTTIVQEIDVENMIHVVNGTDLLASTRAALGM